MARVKKGVTAHARHKRFEIAKVTAVLVLVVQKANETVS